MGFKIKNKLSNKNTFKLYKELDEAEELVLEDTDEAIKRLENLNRRFPYRPEILGVMVNAYAFAKNNTKMVWACRKLLKYQQNLSFVMNNLAIGYATEGRVALATKTYREMLKKFPNEDSDKNRETLSVFEAEVNKIMLSNDFTSGEDGFEMACLHEEAQVLLDEGEYSQARQTALQILRKHPNAVPPRNNISLMYFFEGNLPKAIEVSKEVLTIAPNNPHALGNLARYSFYLGKYDETQNYANRLKAFETDEYSRALKQIETFSYLGDNEAVVEVFQKYGEKKTAEFETSEFIFHLVAVAFYNLGKTKEARKYWKKSLEIEPGFHLATENLAELDLPEHERNAPFPFSFSYWLPKGFSKKLIDLSGQVLGDDPNQKAIEKQIQKLFADNPFFLNVFRQLLERGDRTQRNLAIIILPLVNTPESLETLKQFAFGQKGSDDLRNSAALKLAEKGYIGKNVRLWVKGQWMDLKLLAFKINPEAMDNEKYTAQAMKLMEKAIAALKRNDGKTADSILQEVLKIHPDSPSALNNLSMAYELQNRREESYQLVREIHERFPDYSFGRINLAHILLRQGKKEEAFDLIQPILELSELHTTEMSGLARFQIEYYLKIKQKESARYWLEMWNQVDPECDYEYWEMKINGIGKTLMQSLLGFERKY